LNSSIFIPKTINVGYQNRSGTYTGKLAYVIYYDEKGKLRKEASWNSWRDDKIPNDEFENVPTEGFVLNKKAGDYSTGWDHRHAYCRVYDPRGFEFEITIENLLYILENANCIKGKGLEGEFIYGWDGKDLVLMPVESPDYKQISEFNKIIHNNETIKAKDLIIGATYLTKDNENWIYIGKFDVYDQYGNWENWENKGKHFWFWRGSYFEHYRSIPKNKFIKCIDDKCNEKYANIFDKLEGEPEYSPYDSSKDEYKYFTLDEFKEEHGDYWRRSRFISEYYSGNKYVFDTCKQDNDLYIVSKIQIVRNYYYPSEERVEVTDIFPTTSKMVKSNRYPYKDIEEKHMIPVTLEKIFEVMKPMYIQKYLANGREYKKEYEIK
jgi:hypothetical protein